MSQAKYDEVAVKQIIISGIENDADVDAIKLEMFKSGVPFDKINSVYKEAAIGAGLMADPKVVRADLAKAITVSMLESLENWEDVRETAETLVQEVEGATAPMAIGALRAQAKEHELEFPTKPKASGARGYAGSVIKSLIVDTLNANPEIGSYDLVDMIYAKTSGDYRLRNTLEYFNMYAPVVLAGKHGIPLSEVKMELLDKNELEKKYGGTTSYTKKAAAEDAEEDGEPEDAEDDDDLYGDTPEAASEDPAWT